MRGIFVIFAATAGMACGVALAADAKAPSPATTATAPVKAPNPYLPSSTPAGSEPAAEKTPPAAAADTAPKGVITKQSVVRVNGKRFLRFEAEGGAVFMPAIAGTGDLDMNNPLCKFHFSELDEVLVIRDNVPIEPEAKARENDIAALAGQCRAAAPVVEAKKEAMKVKEQEKLITPGDDSQRSTPGKQGGG